MPSVSSVALGGKAWLKGGRGKGWAVKESVEGGRREGKAKAPTLLLSLFPRVQRINLNISCLCGRAENEWIGDEGIGRGKREEERGKLTERCELISHQL